MDKWQGESEQNIKRLFQRAAKDAPALIFFDELDAIAGLRSSGEESTNRVKAELLLQLNLAASKNIFVMGATNCPWALDSAIRRRFERRIYINLPDDATRRDILCKALEKSPHTLSGEDVNKLVAQTDGFSGADLRTLIKAALQRPRRDAVDATHFISVGENLVAPAQPCSECKEGTCAMCGAMALTLSALPVGLKVVRAPLKLEYFTGVKSSVNRADTSQFETWTREFGIT